jgi:hypothetical protein
LKQILPTLAIITFLLGAVAVKADIGETFDMRQQRNRLMEQLHVLEADSTGSFTDGIDRLNRAIILRDSIIALDQRIFESYQQSVDRMAYQKSVKLANDRFLTLLSLVATLSALAVALFLFMAKARVLKADGVGMMELLRQLGSDLVNRTSPEKPGHASALRVNIVVVIGLVMMSLSIMAYLLTKL